MFDDSFKGKKTGVVGFGSEQFIQPVVWVFTNLSMTGSDLKTKSQRSRWKESCGQIIAIQRLLGHPLDDQLRSGNPPKIILA